MSLGKPVLFGLMCVLVLGGTREVEAASVSFGPSPSTEPVLITQVASPSARQPVHLQASQPSREQPARDEFVPIDELPPTEQLPAARFLVLAYVFAWVAILVYVWSIWRRLGKVEQELTAVEERLRQQS